MKNICPGCPPALLSFVVMMKDRSAEGSDTLAQTAFVTMHQHVFINLPVTDLPRAMAFYEALGYRHNPQFTDDTAACIVLTDVIHVMLLTHAKFRDFTPKAICDAHTSTEVLNCLSCESRGELDALVAKAKAAGGSVYAGPKDYGFMYQHCFADPDGHQWELVHMSSAPPK